MDVMQGQLRIQKPAIDEGNHFLVAIATLKARQGILKKTRRGRKPRSFDPWESGHSLAAAFPVGHPARSPSGFLREDRGSQLTGLMGQELILRFRQIEGLLNAVAIDPALNRSHGHS